MSDTSKAVARRYRELLQALEPSQRVEMACRMFKTAMELVEAGIRHKWGGTVSREQLRCEIFLRLYGRDFTERQRSEILRSLT